jgi:hypothetical protein
MDEALVKLQSIERSLLELSQQTLHPHDVRKEEHDVDLHEKTQFVGKNCLVNINLVVGGGGDY